MMCLIDSIFIREGWGGRGVSYPPQVKLGAGGCQNTFEPPIHILDVKIRSLAGASQLEGTRDPDHSPFFLIEEFRIHLFVSYYLHQIYTEGLPF